MKKIISNKSKIEVEKSNLDKVSIHDLKLWIESSINKKAWIEPLKSSQNSDETWVTKNHPELFDGNHPLYVYSDDELKEHDLIIIGSTPISHNYVKNFKLTFDDKYPDYEKE